MKNARLPEHEHSLVFERLIAPNALCGTSPAHGRPKAIIIAGAPGSGKGGLTAMARKEFEGSPTGHVEIDVDELRHYHRDYERLRLGNDRTAAAAVQHDATRWGDELRQRCVEEHRNVIIDGTLKDPEKATAMAAELRKAGYETELRVMGLPKPIAVQGVYRRYEHAKAEGRAARWVPEHIVEAAHLGMPQSVATLHDQGAVDRISVYHRDPKRPTDARGRLALRAVSTTQYHEGRAQSPPPPHEALRAVRTRALTPDEEIAYRIECKRICAAIARRDEGLNEPENMRAFELAQHHGAEVHHPRLKAQGRKERGASQRSAHLDFRPPPGREERSKATPTRQEHER